ncbi:general stress protein [Bacillus sp. sid0103]|uniref:general stress protein n=1 Tax=Bacillus sp. sid0103 TaxID=2856337 RepID=UPI001C474BC8|nr:general stress protein [Bacillus sp. sid0103]MBV7505215.1 general stress protein [Bacillus sp. sid0103]
MDKHGKNIVGVYQSEQEAIAAIEDLQKWGYDKSEISVIGKDPHHVDYVADETGTVAEETAATGAITGGALGGATGLLAGLGALAIPGIGPIVAAGPVAASILGAITGAGLGGLTGALVGLGIPDDDAKYYGESVEEGKILVLVNKRDHSTQEDIPSDVEPTPEKEEDRFNTIRERNPALNNKF